MMKTFKLMMYALLLMFAACSDGGSDEPNVTPPNKPDTSKPTITFDTGTNTKPVVATEGGTSTIIFTATQAWTASVSESRAIDWISVSPTSGGAGETMLTITTKANETFDERNASITISSGGQKQTVTVSQKQKDALTVTSNKVEMTAEGGTTSIEVKANINYTYEIEESAQSWITKAESRGLSTTTFTLQVAPNESATKREGKVTVKSSTFSEVVTIYQEGSTPTLVLTANEYIAGRSGDFIKVELKSNVEFEVLMPNVDWIKEFSQAHASSTHTYQYEISENQEGIERKAEIIYKQKDGTLSDTVRIVQFPYNPILLSQKKYIVSVDGEEFDFNYKADEECVVEIPESDNWISVTEVETRGLLDKKLHVKIAPNQTKADRFGKIVFRNIGDEGVDTVSIKQVGEAFYLRVPGHDENIDGTCNYQGGLFGFDVESNGDYKFEIVGEDTSWLHYDRRVNTDNNKYTDFFIVDQNNTGKLRKCHLQFTLGNITRKYGFGQAEKRSLILGQTEYNVSANGGTFPLEIKADGGNWATMSPFYFYHLSDGASSWVTFENNAKEGHGYDNAKLIIQPNLTSKPRTATLTLEATASGVQQNVTITQSAQGAIVLSQLSYILSSSTHTLSVDLNTSDYAVEINSEASSWISLGQKSGEGNNVKQELVISANESSNERKGNIIFTSGSTKNQVSITQLMIPPTLVDDTPTKWHQFPLSKVELILNNPKSEGSQIYNAIVPDCEALIAVASHKVLDCLYDDPNNPLIPKKERLEYVLEDFSGVSSNANQGMRIRLSNQYLANYYHTYGAEAMIKENIGILTHEITHSYQGRPKNCGDYMAGTHYFAFIEGVADAVRVLCGGFPNESDRPRGGHYMDAYRHGGFFIAWLVKNKDANFLRKFNESAHKLETWTFDAGVKYALGESYSADALWNEYQKAMGDI